MNPPTLPSNRSHFNHSQIIAPQSADQTLPFTKAAEQEVSPGYPTQEPLSPRIETNEKNITSQIEQEEIISENHFKSITTNSNSQYQFQNAILGSSSVDDSKIKGSYCDWRKLWTPCKFAPASSVQQLADVLFKQTKNSFNFQKSQISAVGVTINNSSNAGKHHRPRMSDLSASNIGSWRSRDLCYVEPVNEFMNQEDSKNQIQIDKNDDCSQKKVNQFLKSQARIKSALKTQTKQEEEEQEESSKQQSKHNRNVSQISINSNNNDMVIDLMTKSQRNEFYQQLEKRYFNSGLNKTKSQLSSQQKCKQKSPKLKKVIPLTSSIKQRSFSISSSSSSSQQVQEEEEEEEEPVKQSKKMTQQISNGYGAYQRSSTTSPVIDSNVYKLNNNFTNINNEYSQQKTFITSSPSSHIKNTGLFSQNTEVNDGEDLTIRSNERDGQLTIGVPIPLTCDELEATQNSIYNLHRECNNKKRNLEQQCENAVLKAYQQGIKKAAVQRPESEKSNQMMDNLMRWQMIQRSDLPVEIEEEGEDLDQSNTCSQQSKVYHNNIKLMKIPSANKSLMKRTLEQIPTTSSIVKHIRKASITTNKAQESKSNLTFALDNQDEQEEVEREEVSHKSFQQNCPGRNLSQQIATPRERVSIQPTPTHRKQTSHFFRKQLATPPSEHRKTVRPLIHHYQKRSMYAVQPEQDNLIPSNQLQKDILNRETVRRGRNSNKSNEIPNKKMRPVENSIRQSEYDISSRNVLTTNGNSSINQSAISVLFGAVETYLSNIKTKNGGNSKKRKNDQRENQSESVLSQTGEQYISSSIDQDQSQQRFLSNNNACRLNTEERGEILIQNPCKRQKLQQRNISPLLLLDSELKHTLYDSQNRQQIQNGWKANDKELLQEYEQYQTGSQNFDFQYNSLEQPLSLAHEVKQEWKQVPSRKLKKKNKVINQKRLLQAFEQKAQSNIKVYKQMLKKQMKSKNELTQRITAMQKLVQQIQSAVINKNNLSSSQSQASEYRNANSAPPPSWVPSNPIIVPTSISLFPNIPSGNYQEQILGLISKCISNSNSQSSSQTQMFRQLKNFGGIKQQPGSERVGAQSSSSTTERTRNSQHLCANQSRIQIESSSSSARNSNNPHILSGTGSLGQLSSQSHKNINFQNQELKRVNDRLAQQLEENLQMFERLNKALMLTENKAISREKEISQRDKQIFQLKVRFLLYSSTCFIQKQCQDLMGNIAKIYTLGRQLGICNSGSLSQSSGLNSRHKIQYSNAKQEIHVPEKDSPGQVYNITKSNRTLSSPPTPFERADNLSSHRNSSLTYQHQHHPQYQPVRQSNKNEQENNFMMMLSEQDSKASQPLLKQSLSSQSFLLKSSQNISIRESPILKNQSHHVKNVQQQQKQQQQQSIIPQLLKQSSSSSSIMNPCSNSSSYLKCPENSGGLQSENKISSEQERNIRNSKASEKFLRISLAQQQQKSQNQRQIEKQNYQENNMIDQSLVINVLSSPQQFQNSEYKNQSTHNNTHNTRQNNNMTQSLGTCSGSVLIAQFMRSILGQQASNDQLFGRQSGNTSNQNQCGNSIAFSGSFANSNPLNSNNNNFHHNKANQSGLSSLRLSESAAGLSQHFRQTGVTSNMANAEEGEYKKNCKRESFGGIETSSSMNKDLRKSLVERMAPSCLKTSDVESVLKSIQFATLVSKHNEKLQQNQFQASKSNRR